MFEDEVSTNIREIAMESKFIQGMKRGILSAEQHGRYMVQYTAYLFSAVATLESAAEQMEIKRNLEFAYFYMTQVEKYKQYYEVSLKTWGLENAEGVGMGPAAKMYVAYQSVLSKNHPRFLSLGMLPCTMLWRWIASSLFGSVEKHNPYYSWFDENKKPMEYQGSLEKFVEAHFKPEEMKETAFIFCEGMMGELNFSLETGGEPTISPAVFYSM